MSTRSALFPFCILLATALTVLAAADVPPVADQANLGVGIQRTMSLLATSTPDDRKPAPVHGGVGRVPGMNPPPSAVVLRLSAYAFVPASVKRAQETR